MPRPKSEPFIRVRNWDVFQHYRDRSPPWIKLHSSVLDDLDFEMLPDVVKGHLMLIWLLASRTDNTLPVDSSWITRKIGANTVVNIALMVERGYLEVCNGEGKPLSGAARNRALAKC